MARLTEEMIIARSKQSDLTAIKKLNCWGSELSDVSIIRRLKGVEVLALSVNKISSLSDFESCPNLQELYLRKNNIQDIADLVYLQNLTKLKYLWLEENPCVDSAGPNYRKIVLRALPKLVKLDNVEVTPEEVSEALRGPIDSHQPQHHQQKEEVYEEDYETAYRAQAAQSSFRGHSPVREQQQPMQHSPEGTEPESISDPIDRPSSVPTSPSQRSAPNHQQDIYPTTQTSEPAHNAQSPRYQNQRNQQSFERSPDDSPHISGNYRDQRANLPSSMSTHSMKDYYQGDNGYQRGAPPPAHYRHSQTDLTEWDEQAQQNGHHQNGHSRDPPPSNRRSMIANGGSQDRYPEETRRDLYQYRNGNVSREDFGEEMADRRRDTRRDTSVINNAVLNHLAGLHRRPVNRSSNLLSAVLCLVKELDYASLEVVEHAVRCRIDELAENM